MAQVNIRIDDELKEKAESLFNELGMTISTAFTVFVRQAVREGGLPFTVTTRSETLLAMSEAERIGRDASAKGYRDIDALLKDLKADE